MMTKCHPLMGYTPGHIRSSIRKGGQTGEVGSFGLTRVDSEGIPQMHYGVDLLCSPGCPVFAAHDGIVIRIGEQAGGVGYGQRVYLRGDNITTVYAHLSGMIVQESERVRAGHLLGFTGRSGNVGDDIPTHLHLEVRKGGGGREDAIDPITWLYS